MFKAECVRQVAAGARQTDVARAQGILSALLGRWQCQALMLRQPTPCLIIHADRGS